jgi:hypothetical protein
VQKASQMELKKTQGLPSVLELKIGMIVDMTCNPDTSDGLSNGAWGILKHVDLSMQDNEDRHVAVLWIAFENERVGKKLRSTISHLYSQRPELDASWTPIYRISKTFTIDKRTNKSEIHRTQFPVRPAIASIVHHCQG